MLSRNVFREYDIRGVAEQDFTDDNVIQLGKAIGTYLKGGNLVVGRDNRFSSPRIQKALIKGILSTGCNVTDIGQVTTPVFYYSIVKLNKSGGVVVTASHNPSEYNGFKINNGPDSLFGEQIQEIYKILESGKFLEGEGSLDAYDILPDYFLMLKEKFRITRPLKVVVDCGNGTPSPINPQLIRGLGCEVIELYCDSDPNFPNHHPDPTKEENMVDAIAKVKETGADLGIGFDGDGDRLGVIDDKGKLLMGDELLIIYARDFLKQNSGGKILSEVKSSQALADEVKKSGGTLVIGAAGHSLIKNRMKQDNIMLAGEVSGHMFFGENNRFDDALYATCKLLEILSNTDKKLSELLSDIPKYYSSPELRVDCPDDKKFDIVEGIKNNLKQDYEVIDVDGVRFITEEGWGLIRASNTQPVLVVRYESKTEEGLNKLKQIINDQLAQHGIELK